MCKFFQKTFQQTDLWVTQWYKNQVEFDYTRYSGLYSWAIGIKECFSGDKIQK
jgi:hypothetical protein